MFQLDTVSNFSVTRTRSVGPFGSEISVHLYYFLDRGLSLIVTLRRGEKES